MKSTFLPHDVVKVKGIYASRRRLGGSRERMLPYIGMESTVTKAYNGDIASLQGIPYAFLAEDLELIERPPQPEWTPMMYRILEGRANSHRLCYCIYNSKRGVPPKRSTDWVTSGFCFQSFSASLSKNGAADRLRWNFQLKPSDAFTDQRKTKTIPDWWLTKWWRMGAFPEDVKLKDLKAGILDMPIRKYDKKYRQWNTLPTNRVYYAVCLVRHIYEWWDGIVALRYLVEKLGIDWWTALSMIACDAQSSKGHSLWGCYSLPNTRYNKGYERVLMHAVMHQRYFDYGREFDTTRTVFKFWSTVKYITGFDNHHISTAVLTECKKTVKSRFDLNKFNPKEVTTHVEISKKRRITGTGEHNEF
jgi:hypothetical protein